MSIDSASNANHWRRLITFEIDVKMREGGCEEVKEVGFLLNQNQRVVFHTDDGPGLDKLAISSISATSNM